MTRPKLSVLLARLLLTLKKTLNKNSPTLLNGV
jgi:hypothetical protein